MPAKADKYTLKSPFLSRRVKLLPCQKERIKRMHEIENYGIRQLARMFKVNRRTIQFICYPERQEANKAAREKRGESKIYYNRARHTKAIKHLKATPDTLKVDKISIKKIFFQPFNK